MDKAPNSLLAALIEAGNIDTVYRDVYLDRARTLLAPVLSLEEFQRLERQRAALAELPPTIARAIEKSNWSLVKELSQRAEESKQAIDGKRTLLETARGVYDVRDVRLDPFSPGLQSFTRMPARDLSALRTKVLTQLATLERADIPWNDFYAARRAAFQALRGDGRGRAGGRGPDHVSGRHARRGRTGPPSRRHEAVGGAGRRVDRRPRRRADRPHRTPPRSARRRHAASRARRLSRSRTPATRWPGRGSSGWRRVIWSRGWTSPRFAGTRGPRCPTRPVTPPPSRCQCLPGPRRASGMG